MQLIIHGRVEVNGRKEHNPHRWIDLLHDKISIDGTRLQERKKIYLLLHKPRGVVTTASDEKGRQTVLDLVGPASSWMFPVGRLDKESSGLLLVTNDHELANRLTDPHSDIDKKYIVETDKPIQREHLAKLGQGVVIMINGQPYRTKPARTRLLGKSQVEITITEGKNRQLRRMFEHLGYEVVTLHRVAVGPLNLGNLRAGESRPLSEREISELSHLKERALPRQYRDVGKHSPRHAEHH
jgi:pseudouridine synthase